VLSRASPGSTCRLIEPRSGASGKPREPQSLGLGRCVVTRLCRGFTGRTAGARGTGVVDERNGPPRWTGRAWATQRASRRAGRSVERPDLPMSG
jgi:hypothetical protein